MRCSYCKGKVKAKIWEYDKEIPSSAKDLHIKDYYAELSCKRCGLDYGHDIAYKSILGYWIVRVCAHVEGVKSNERVIKETTFFVAEFPGMV